MTNRIYWSIIAACGCFYVSGTKRPEGDPFLQRQHERSVAVSARNPAHLLAEADDYLTADLVASLAATTANPDTQITGEACLGVFKSFDARRNCITTLSLGCRCAVAAMHASASAEWASPLG
jgi:hypothetical protein